MVAPQFLKIGPYQGGHGCLVIPFDRGVCGMARSQMPNSANSQFFIMFDDGHFLNGQYTVWGRVSKGMEHVDAITRGEPPANPDHMVTVRVEDAS